MKTLYQLISNVCAVAKPFIVPTMWLKYYKILFKIVTNNCFLCIYSENRGGDRIKPSFFRSSFHSAFFAFACLYHVRRGRHNLSSFSSHNSSSVFSNVCPPKYAGRVKKMTPQSIQGVALKMTAFLIVLLLILSVPAFAAKCIHDPDFKRFPDGTTNNPQSRQPYFFVAMGDNETAPPVHWKYKSIQLTWPPYDNSSTKVFKGYRLHREDGEPYGKPANDAEPILAKAVTTANRVNLASRSRMWTVYVVFEDGSSSPWASAATECGQTWTGHHLGKVMRPQFLTTNSNHPEPAPAKLPYPRGKYKNNPHWDPYVKKIREERAAGYYDITASITSQAAGTVYGSFSITITFSKIVTGFSLSDLVITNGSASELGGSGRSYTATITPSSSGIVTVSIPAGAADGWLSTAAKFSIRKEDASLVSFSSSSSSMNENGGTRNVQVNLSPTPASGITVTYTVGGSATRGTDYTTSGSVSVSANVSSVNIPVVITDDTADENDETVILTLSDGDGYTLGTAKTHTLTINDNDDPPPIPVVSFSSSSSSMNENGGTRNVQVNLSPTPASGITVTYTVGGSATRGTDYTTSGSVSVSANVSSVNIPVVITDDTADENDETVILTLSDGDGYTLGTAKTHTLTINDNDDPPPIPVVSFSSSSSSMNENGGTRNVQVNLSPTPASGITVTYTVGGSATRGTDYTTSGSVSVSANVSSVNISVVITDDTADENDETVILTLSSGDGYTLGTAKTHTLTINDNDSKKQPPPPIPVVSFSSSSSSMNENGGTRNVQVNLSPTPASGITVTYTVGGSATRGTDYTTSGSVSVSANVSSVNIPVVITDDTADENDETVILTLSDGDGYTLGTAKTHTLTINDNDDPPPIPVVSFSSSSSSMNENGGTRNVQVNLSPTPASGITVTYTVGGSATRGTDYTTSGSVSVSANVSSVNIPVVITDDTADENDETVILTLSSGKGYTVGTAKTHTLTINDNDSKKQPPPPIPVVSFSSSSSSMNENGGTRNVQVNLSPTPASGITVTYTVGGSATRGTDYTTSGSVSVSANVSSVNIPVVITDDTADENDETVILTLSSGDGYTLGTAKTHTLTINDNDDPPPPPTTNNPPPRPSPSPPPRPSRPSPPPPPPSEPIVTRALATSIVVNWQHPTEDNAVVSSYDLRYREGSAGDFIDGPQNVTGTRAFIYGLNPDTEYEIQVRASNSAGDSDWSELVMTKTRTFIPKDRFSLSLDLDDVEGDQFMSCLSIFPGEIVAVQIFGSSLKAIPLNDLYMRLDYDATQVVYHGFKMGSILTGVSMISGKNFLDIGMTLPDSKTRADSGLMGTIRFSATDALSETEIRLVRVKLFQKGQDETIPMYRGVALKKSSGPLIVADFDKNGAVDIPDFLLFVDMFGLTEDQKRYDSKYDLDKNGEIGISDFLIFVKDFGKDFGKEEIRHTPTFTSERPVMRMVEENTSSGNPIGDPVSATMADGAALTYSLWGVDAEYFSIDANTGQLLTKAQYNFEHRNWYSPIVRVSDEEGSSTSVVVNIAIINVVE